MVFYLHPKFTFYSISCPVRLFAELSNAFRTSDPSTRQTTCNLADMATL